MSSGDYCQGDSIGVPCRSNNYSWFDEVSQKELRSPPTLDSIVNQSAFCTLLPLDFIHEHGEDALLTVPDLLKGLQGKVGLYLLWREEGYCQDHGIHALSGLYVGKGDAQGRVCVHCKREDLARITIHVSFYECENRLAKYFEQLLLDRYKFDLNIAESRGAHPLHARWTVERFEMGTQTQAHADILAKKHIL